MTMATNYCNTGISLDKNFAQSEWSKTPGLSARQQEAYMNSEQKQRDRLLGKYPHKYIATLQPDSKIYDVEMVFADGSKLDCIPASKAEIDYLKENGNIVEIL